WMLRQHEAQRLEHFLDCLVEFGFSGVFRFYLVHYFLNVIARSFDSGRGHNTSAHNNPPVLAARESCPETMIAVTLQPIGVGSLLPRPPAQLPTTPGLFAAQTSLTTS